MLTYEESAALMSDPVFRGRVKADHKPPVWQLSWFPDEDPVPVALRNQGNP